MTKQSNTTYFDKAGPKNTSELIRLIREKTLDVNPDAVVVASTSGKTGLEVARAFEGTGVRILVVPFQNGTRPARKYGLPDPELKKQCESLGGLFLPDNPKCGLLDDERNDLIRGWYCLGQGIKVALQIATMCVDLELIPEGATVISAGGTGEGADAAVLMKVFGWNNVQKNRINEIIAMVS